MTANHAKQKGGQSGQNPCVAFVTMLPICTAASLKIGVYVLRVIL